MKVQDERFSPLVSASPQTTSDRAASLAERVQSLRMPDTARGHRSSLGWLPWMLCVLLAVTTGALGYRLLTAPQSSAADAGTSSEEKAAVSSNAKPASTTAANPTAGASNGQNVVLESKGYIIAAHQILVSPKVSGMVTKLTFEEGKRVQKGDVLAEIEDIEYRTDYQRSAADLELAKQKCWELERGNRPEEISQARAQLQEAEAQLETLSADWKRMQELRRNKIATPQDYDQAQSRFKAMARQVERLRFALTLMEAGPRKEKIEAARADVHNAEAAAEKAKWKLDNCRIRSPITGTILKKNAEEGNLVNTIAFSGSVSLCELADLSDLEVDLTVQERDVSRVFKGQKCKVRAEAFADRVYDGVVSRLMPIADRSKGAIPIRVKLRVPREEEGVYLKPEMGAMVTFYGDTPSSAKSPAPVKSPALAPPPAPGKPAA